MPSCTWNHNNLYICIFRRYSHIWNEAVHRQEEPVFLEPLQPTGMVPWSPSRTTILRQSDVQQQHRTIRLGRLVDTEERQGKGNYWSGKSPRSFHCAHQTVVSCARTSVYVAGDGHIPGRKTAVCHFCFTRNTKYLKTLSQDDGLPLSSCSLFSSNFIIWKQFQCKLYRDLIWVIP